MLCQKGGKDGSSETCSKEAFDTSTPDTFSPAAAAAAAVCAIRVWYAAQSGVVVGHKSVGEREDAVVEVEFLRTRELGFLAESL